MFESASMSPFGYRNPVLPCWISHGSAGAVARHDATAGGHRLVDDNSPPFLETTRQDVDVRGQHFLSHPLRRHCPMERDDVPQPRLARAPLDVGRCGPSPIRSIRKAIPRRFRMPAARTRWAACFQRIIRPAQRMRGVPDGLGGGGCDGVVVK